MPSDENISDAVFIATTLASLRERFTKMNELDTKISEGIKVIQAQLRAKTEHMNRVVQIHVGDGEWLAWSSFKGEWRFVVKDEGRVNPLLSCNRETRGFMSGAPLRQLVNAVLKEAGLPAVGAENNAQD